MIGALRWWGLPGQRNVSRYDQTGPIDTGHTIATKPYNPNSYVSPRLPTSRSLANPGGSCQTCKGWRGGEASKSYLASHALTDPASFSSSLFLLQSLLTTYLILIYSYLWRLSESLAAPFF